MKGIRILLFGRVKEIAGTAEVELPAAPGTTTGALLRALVEKYPGIEPWREYLRVAVNQEYSPSDRAVSPGDEVAVIPPVSGG
jgi:molybdopterin synthase catalytic subunit